MYPEDVEVMHELLSITGLSQLPCDQVWDVIVSVGNHSEMPQASFNQCVRTFIGRPITDKGEVELVSRVLSNCFAGMDRTHSGEFYCTILHIAPLYTLHD